MASTDPDGEMLDELAAAQEPGESPRHGFRGEPHASRSSAFQPVGLTIAVSREAGARGSTIARRAGDKLGWQVYSQELLEHISQEGSFRQALVENLPPGGQHWVEQRLDQLLREQNLSRHPSVLDMARIVLGLGVQGDVILVGRGAGCVLPRESTLHVRVVAPLEDRIAYMSQWLRLTVPEATTQVTLRDQRRAEFLATHFHCQANNVYQYDLLLNSSLLGEELCAELIVQAARAKQDRRER
jgi:cytidylate kinase